ncbi:MAG: hypothetical protein CO029_04740 [Candidatus Magasanikbacteria bacterium CG_4_9_14_0_2_um_filter_41_10]|uniref:UDP-N-acetylmuramoyl-L-alanyl-D-glutamate--2, 6-diaminopimelate ligase n=1 Tax=Candidatus Magasanikbacteria bacterium CG_4_10_14_0_2_um_filter_41_31 TaxID=1974639 RepID=A0A2M7V5Q0_9BACT|nr:MAG: hypothetical protein AUJ37_02775 [Candidatus Magasanikbacteria bacterium CG1_02_41_34]PIZ93940.1 MAG: hypothetical protein COX83_00660 [Candidatus Magasanikbacteria bacterium CG_4_10_14_0_2_um_filter_41_31]PJC53058.1 MAG: hypothetical protein CO029_04740 [Candidatus Magasanikbacteria bacterium CG_4_9_14_0_2_um_filter_41_10]
MSPKATVKKIVPKSILNIRHLFYAWLGAMKFGNPSEELLVIGVTGTSGKSTTVYLLRQLLESAGYTVGALSTIEFSIAGEHHLNDKKMTMLGKTQIQEYLRKMVEKGCTIAIVETTSEGRVQYRHRFINYDMMLLTNLYPEHIDSHGSFEKYRQAKIDLFEYAARSRRKTIKGKRILKMALINRSVMGYTKFASKRFDKINFFDGKETLHAEDIMSDNEGIHFKVHERTFSAPMYGEHNAKNIVACMAVARALDISWGTIEKAVETFHNVPGRIEFISEAEVQGFQVIVDYAFEPVAMKKLYEVVDLLKPKRVLHVFGSTGGGRDKARRFTLGEFIGEHANMCFVTDEDPYEDDPMKIIEDVATAVKKVGKKKGINLFVDIDRRKAITAAIGRAKPGDLVLITGKGSEQAMCIAGGNMIPWDDRMIAREAIEHRAE